MIAESDIETLTPEEKHQLVGKIWASLVSKLAAVPVSHAEKLLLEERWARHQQSPEAALTLEAFKRRVSVRECQFLSRCCFTAHGIRHL